MYIKQQNYNAPGSYLSSHIIMSQFSAFVAILATCLTVLVSTEHSAVKRFSLNPFTAAVDMASNAIDSVGLSAVNPIKLTSDAMGAAVGGMGLLLGKQENKKCYYYWGLGFSGPESWNPERWNGESWDAEDSGGLLHAAGNVVGMGFGLAFSGLGANEEFRVQGCKMLGMGYSTQQPGFPSKPGTCPQGPDCYGTPGKSIVNPGHSIPQMPPGTTVVYTIPGRQGTFQQGTPGSVMTLVTPGQAPMYIPGTDTQQTINYPGQYIPGTPPSQQYITTQRGQPPQYIPGSPPTQQIITRPGSPPQMIPGTPPSQQVINIPGQSPQYIPGMCSCPCQ